ncbi:uncharacterized protein LOC134790648 [Cydia splendana]|uniref:uncharacterized protein LOC134790648 n=1 Tax=Cydia splendana TaxID=1100963 RepID=UPI00300D2DDF
MSGAASEAEAGRARPLSGGLWSLISWLRRDDSGASSDSLSSVGSDRTVASFAFLAPDRYRHPAAPVFLPPPGPPTDSYKKRLRDRNSRLQHDRDLTLHRKYGLFRGENGYDAFSLPPARKTTENNWEERERRATSECLQRRAAHVPGKRRAPAPPARAATLGGRSRKRPAPQPPRRPLSELGRNAPIPEEPLLLQTDLVDPALRRTESMDCKPEKYIKKEIKNSKPRTEKSFLKQIFEGRKRNSAVETIPERILPSISELDKQAAEIIESCKLKAIDRSNEKAAGTSRELLTPSRGDMWFCTRCLRKYNDSVVTCGYCITEQQMQLNKNDSDRRLANRASNHYTQTELTNVASTSGVNVVEEKQKLKEMLKEIKDSLPKRPKHEENDIKKNNHNNHDTQEKEIRKSTVVEAPTLRIGTKISEEEKVTQNADSKSVNIEAGSKNNDVKVVTNRTPTSATETAVVTQPIVLQHVPSRDIVKLQHFKIAESKQCNLSMNAPTAFDNKHIITSSNSIAKNSIIPESKFKISSDSSTSGSAPSNVPLKISSLLNSSLIIEKQLQTKPYDLQPGTQVQRSSNQTTTTAHEAKPLVAPKLLADTILNAGLRDINTATTSTSAPKAVHKNNLTSQEQATQKPLKATSTTQTSSSVVFDIDARCKRNTTIIKDQEVNNNLSHLKADAERNNESPKLPTSSPSFGISSSGSHTSTLSSAPGPSLDDKQMNIDNIGNQQQKSLFQNAPCKVTSEIRKLDTPRISDSRQHNPALKVVPFDLHLRRRDLINQLEQSIAKGDERAAADAAAKLAQLRLSCSVLSFSSQIVGAPSTSLTDPVKKTNNTVSDKAQMEDTTQTNDPKISNTTSPNNVAASPSKTPIEKKPAPMQPKSGALEKKNKPVENEREKINEASTSNKNDAAGNDNVSIEVWIEDREAARGPIRMNMPRVSVIGDLRRQANASFGLAAHLQRWIVGRTLCTDDNTPLNMLAGPKFDAPFYLCLVEPDTNKQTALRPGSSSNNKTEDKNQNVDLPNGENKATDVYAELVLLERRALVPNAEVFECGVCMENYQPGEGAVLRECVHTFCMECLSDVVKHSEEPAVSCPAMGCPGFLQEREIRALVSPEEYERWLARGLAAAESGTRNAFHCRTADCQGWALCEPGVTRFPCPVCKRTNCVSCQAIHESDTCEQYRAKQRAAGAANRAPAETDEGTRAFLDTLISRGEALECPECSAIITKKWGCDWIKCSACKTEICWVTRGRRWGPAGRGDTSAGCRCGVDGKRCHPSCGYCH